MSNEIAFQRTDPNFDERDDLIDQLRRGSITPRIAEQVASRKGLKPIEFEPNPDDHDAARKPRWSLPMTLAWLVWGDLEQVRLWDNDFRRKCFDLKLREHVLPSSAGGAPKLQRGYYLEQRAECTSIYLEIECDDLSHSGELPPNAFRDAREKLWNELMDGRLTAEAYFQKTETIVDIPPQDWPRLEVYQDHAEQEYLGYKNQHGMVSRYKSVLLKQSEVRLKFPASTKIVSTGSAERCCRAWLIGEIKRSPTKRLKSRSVYLVEARKQYKRLSDRGFARAWDAAIDETGALQWKKPGPTMQPTKFCS